VNYGPSALGAEPQKKTTMLKCCTKCGEDKPLSAFAKSKTERFGVRSKCKDCVKLYNRQYRDQTGLNKGFVPSGLTKAERDKRWRLLNPDRRRQNNAAYRARKKHATLGDFHQDVADLYWLAKDLEKVSGEEYHVDHIIPLAGKDVCGLHVPWNLQVLPADVNMSKNNSTATKEDYVA